MKASRRVLPAAEPRELTCIAWGFTAMGVSFSQTFTTKLLAATLEARCKEQWQQQQQQQE